MKGSLVLLVACLAGAVCAAPTWHIVNGSLATDIVGVAFTSATEGFVSGDANGVGPLILKTTNGGVDWDDCQANFGPDLLLLDVDAAVESIVVSSVFGELYSVDDGASFNPSKGGGQSQNVRYLGTNGDGGKKFGCAGTYKFGKVQGVAVSQDGGKTFVAFNASLFTLARYAAFPTDTTWYVAAGEWPSTDRVKEPLRKSFFHDARGKLRRYQPNYKPQPVGDAGWLAQISKTTDGGKTWKTVFANNGSFYFNGIDCAPNDPNHCCAVGESSGISAGGARIHCTTDGGKTWNRTFFMPETQKEHYSLMELRYVDANTIWAVGGEMTAIEPSAWFLLSTDGGQTWAQGSKPLPGYMAFSLSMVNGNLGFASVDNLITQTAGVAKFS
eukprot:m.14551 g.14551  ORF g.14551 m.14551 type:complete len:385 (+) comp7155_c0_seq2:65-1219(+)